MLPPCSRQCAHNNTRGTRHPLAPHAATPRRATQMKLALHATRGAARRGHGVALAEAAGWSSEARGGRGRRASGGGGRLRLR
eukprot:4007431-Pleurochrysis_carterae.AAC.3